jgi:hypothetical protein
MRLSNDQFFSYSIIIRGQFFAQLYVLHYENFTKTIVAYTCD